MIGIGAIAGFADTAVQLIKDYFPPDMSAEKKAKLEMALKEQACKEDLRQQELALKEREQFQTRIKELEGSAEELKGLPVVGRVILFLRGVQRPLWGLGTFYLNYLFLTGQLPNPQQVQILLYIMNMLVLGFLFGDKAAASIKPMLANVLKAGRKT